MKKTVVFLSAFCVVCTTLFSQINISAAYTRIGTNFEYNSDLDGFPTAATLALGYRIPLKQKRVEFFPQISLLQSSKKSYGNTLNVPSNDMSQTVQMIGGKLDARFYFFDFGGDCNCPTWNDKGQLFKKGFFMMLTGGGHSFQLLSERDTDSYSTSDFVFSFGGGAGLDIVFSERFAMTPFVTYERTNKADWGLLRPCDACNQRPDVSAMGLLSAGLHFRYLWKKGRY